MKLLIVLLFSLLLLTACVTTKEGKKDNTKDITRTVLLPSLIQEKCGDYSFLYGILKSIGNRVDGKKRGQGYTFRTYLGYVSLLDLEPSEKLSQLEGKYFVIVGKLRSITITGLPYPDGRPARNFQQHSMTSATVLEEVRKNIAVDGDGITKKCNELKAEQNKG